MHKMKNKVLIIMADSRPLKGNIETYYKYAAAINKIYADRHGYDFKYCMTKRMYFSEFFSVIRLFIKKILRYREKSEPINKLMPSCYNSKLKQLRSSPWIRLIALTGLLNDDYNQIVYIDSDCIFKDQSKPIEKYVSNTKALEGSAIYSKAFIGFLKNTPWHDNLPCSGFFVIKNTDESKKFIDSWWNLDNKKYNFLHTYDQNSLHKIYQKYSEGICLWDDIFFIEKEGQFLRHVHSGESTVRLDYFRNYYSRLTDNDSKKLYKILSDIEIVYFDPSM